MAPFLPIRATSRSQAVRIGKQTVKQGTTTYVDLAASVESSGHLAGSSLPYSPYKELQNHLAIGAVIVVGDLTASNSEFVEIGAATAGEVTVLAENEKEFEIKVAAGEIKNRNTGVYQATEAKTNAKTKAAKKEKEKIDRVEVKTSTGAVKFTLGTEAAEGKAVAPAETAGYITVALITSINEEAEKAPKLKVTDKRGRP